MLSLKKFENVAMALMISFGLLFMSLLPPFQGPDEEAHFFRTVGILSGEFVCHNPGISNAGGNVSANLFEFYSATNAEKIKFHPEIKQNMNDLKAASKLYPDEKKSFQGYANACAYSPVAYTVQTLGAGLGTLLGLSWLSIFYVTRLVSLTVFVALTYMAIKKAPRLKWLIVALALMPMTIHQAASVSPDGLTISLSFLFISYVLEIKHSNRSVQKRDYVIIFCMIVIIALLKITYFPLALLLLMIPQSSYGSRKRYWNINLAAIAVSTLVTLGWFLATRLSNIVFPLDPSEQIHNILSDPFGFAKLLLSSFIYNDVIYAQHVGSFGWLDTPLPLIVIILYYCLLFAVSIYEGSKEKELHKENIVSAVISFGVFLSCTLLIHVSLYLNWPQDVPYAIAGVQGRYFLPITFTFFYSIYLLTPFIIKKRRGIIFTIVFFILVFSCYTLFRRYY